MGRADEGIPMKRILNKPEAEVFEGVTDEDIQNEVLEDIGEKKEEAENEKKESEEKIMVTSKKYGKF